jgi:hypothetical protein
LGLGGEDGGIVKLNAVSQVGVVFHWYSVCSHPPTSACGSVRMIVQGVVPGVAAADVARS